MTATPRGPVMVLAPHPDDEVLGTGGTIARLSDAGTQVIVVVVTKGGPPLFDPAFIEQGRREACAAHRILGVAETLYLDFPAARLDQVPHYELNGALLALVAERRPSAVYLPFRGDIHRDHQIVFDSGMVAVRPTNGIQVPEVYAYETLSETNWNAGRGITAPFVPDCFVRIDATLQRKIDAMAQFASQLRPFPSERSLEAIETLARHRGASVCVPAAEAFMTIRRIV